MDTNQNQGNSGQNNTQSQDGLDAQQGQGQGFSTDGTQNISDDNGFNSTGQQGGTGGRFQQDSEAAGGEFDDNDFDSDDLDSDDLDSDESQTELDNDNTSEDI